MKKSFILIFLVILIIPVYALEITKVSDIELRELKINRHIYGNGHVADIINDEIFFIQQDRIQSSRFVTDSTGVMDQEFISLPFGQSLREINVEARYSFATGKELDSSGLYYFGARYYDPNLGRFTSIDPVMENHPYSYVRNNPTNLIDPSGKESNAIAPDPIIGEKYTNMDSGKFLELHQSLIDKGTITDLDLLSNDAKKFSQFLDTYGEKLLETYQSYIECSDGWGCPTISQFNAELMEHFGLINPKIITGQFNAQGNEEKITNEYGHTQILSSRKLHAYNTLNIENIEYIIDLTATQFTENPQKENTLGIVIMPRDKISKNLYLEILTPLFYNSEEERINPKYTFYPKEYSPTDNLIKNTKWFGPEIGVLKKLRKQFKNY